MSKFLRIFIVFNVIIILLMILTDYVITQGLRKSDLREFAVWNDIYSSNINSDIIISGNSRAWCSYSPYIIDSVVGLSSYNLGIVGCPINYQILRYNTFIRFNRKPKYIIQNVDLYTFHYMTDEYEREQFLPYIFDDSLINFVSKDKKITFMDRYCPLIRYYGNKTLIFNGIQSFYGKTKFEDGGMYKGYRGNDWSTDFSAFYKIDTINYSCNKIALHLFQDFLDKCKRQDIHIILVYAPMYYKVKTKIVDYCGLKKMIQNIATRNKLQYFDYTNDSICLDSTNFYNALHLNRKGSETFTLKLSKDLIKNGFLK